MVPGNLELLKLKKNLSNIKLKVLVNKLNLFKLIH